MKKGLEALFELPKEKRLKAIQGFNLQFAYYLAKAAIEVGFKPKDAFMLATHVTVGSWKLLLHECKENIKRNKCKKHTS